jgi:hypothetical protein
VAGLFDAGEPLHVHLQQRASSRPLVAMYRRPRRPRASGEAAASQHLRDRRAGPAHDPGQPRRPMSRRHTGDHDRFLLGRTQLQRRAMRPTRPLSERSRTTPALQPAMPPTVRGRRRDSERGRGGSRRQTPIDGRYPRKPASRSQLRVSVQIHPGPPLGAGLGGPAHTSRRAE